MGIFGSRYLPTPRPTRENKLLLSLASANTGLRELSHGSWTLPGRGLAIRRAYAQPASHGKPHAQFQTGFELGSVSTDWPCELTK